MMWREHFVACLVCFCASAMVWPTVGRSEPSELRLTGAASRRQHRDAGTFDLPLSLVGAPTIEPRGSGSESQMVLTFNQPPEATDGSIDCDDEILVTHGTCYGITQSGNELTVDMGFDGFACVTVTLDGLVGLTGNADVQILTHSANFNKDAIVNLADTQLIINNIFQPLNEDTFIFDVVLDGPINFVDVSEVNSQFCRYPPPTCPCDDSTIDSDGDGTPDCEDRCPDDPDKVYPGHCGCGIPAGSCGALNGVLGLASEHGRASLDVCVDAAMEGWSGSFRLTLSMDADQGVSGVQWVFHVNDGTDDDKFECFFESLYESFGELFGPPFPIDSSRFMRGEVATSFRDGFRSLALRRPERVFRSVGETWQEHFPGTFLRYTFRATDVPVGSYEFSAGDHAYGHGYLLTNSNGYADLAAGERFTLNVLPPEACGDFDRDSDVDADDFGVFQACQSGVQVPAEGECEEADVDGDGDVDQADFGIFQRCLSGPDTPMQPECRN